MAKQSAADELLARIRAVPHNGKIYQADDVDYLLALAAKMETGFAVAINARWYRDQALLVKATLARIAELEQQVENLKYAVSVL